MLGSFWPALSWLNNILKAIGNIARDPMPLSAKIVKPRVISDEVNVLPTPVCESKYVEKLFSDMCILCAMCGSWYKIIIIEISETCHDCSEERQLLRCGAILLDKILKHRFWNSSVYPAVKLLAQNLVTPSFCGNVHFDAYQTVVILRVRA